MSSTSLSKVRALFFDIDDTFSTLLPTGQNKILPEAYSALWALHRVGIATIPVTGRPAGWVDHIARMWPVTAVVGENGAFYASLSGAAQPKLVKRYFESPAVRKKNALKLAKLKKDLAKKFPGFKTPSDQLYREFDLAVDYCEDVPRWSDDKVEKLLAFARSKGAQAKLSSIHVNLWFGKYDKWTCVQKLMKELLGFDESDYSQIVYVGDSPNDEPFFEKLPVTYGVANVRRFLSKMKFHPTQILKEEGGKGFAELAAEILKR